MKNEKYECQRPKPKRRRNRPKRAHLASRDTAATDQVEGIARRRVLLAARENSENISSAAKVDEGPSRAAGSPHALIGVDLRDGGRLGVDGNFGRPRLAAPYAKRLLI